MAKTERFECGDVVIAPPGEMCGSVVRVARHESHRRLDRITVRWKNGHEGVRAAQSLQRADTRLRRRTDVNALWCEHTQCYGLELGKEIITSADGDEWLDENGLHPTSDEFDALTIRLSGGPRDGETVA
jgi:hypothetical protein